MRVEWGIFNDESADHTDDQALEAQFFTRESAEEAMRERYSDEDHVYVHEVEEPEEDEEEDES